MTYEQQRLSAWRELRERTRAAFPAVLQGLTDAELDTYEAAVPDMPEDTAAMIAAERARRAAAQKGAV